MACIAKLKGWVVGGAGSGVGSTIERAGDGWWASRLRSFAHPGTFYFGFESGGQSGDTFSGLPPLCTVGAAEFAPPASGSTALFSTDIEFAVFSSPLPVVAAGDVVQAVSGFASDVPVDWAAAAPTLKSPAIIAAATRVMVISNR
jgi:hypothetical protein